MTEWIERLTKVVALVSLVVGSVAAWYALPLDVDLKKLQDETIRIDNELKLSNAELNRLEASRQLSLQLYQEVKQVLGSKEHSPREEEAVRVLVDSLAEDPFRWKLLDALALGATDRDVKNKAKVTATFFRENDEVPAVSALSQTSTKNQIAYAAFNVDVFSCVTNTDINNSLADAAVAQGKEDGIANWRSRVLPEEINARSGYNIHSNVIRYNANEKTAATALQANLQKSLKVRIELMEIQYPTPNYISVFFCS